MVDERFDLLKASYSTFTYLLNGRTEEATVVTCKYVMDPPPPPPPPPPLSTPLLGPAPPIGGFLDSCLWFLCCCGLFSCCFPPLYEPGPPPL